MFPPWSGAGFEGRPSRAAGYSASRLSQQLIQPRNIISCTELTGTYVSGGVGDKLRNANVWYRVFRTIGRNILPSSFLIEIGGARIVMAGGRKNDAAYWVKINVPDCNRCTKCRRRRLLVVMLNAADTVLAFHVAYYPDVFWHFGYPDDLPQKG